MNFDTEPWKLPVWIVNAFDCSATAGPILGRRDRREVPSLEFGHPTVRVVPDDALITMAVNVEAAEGQIQHPHLPAVDNDRQVVHLVADKPGAGPPRGRLRCRSR